MSRSAYQRELARMVADPEQRLRIERDPITALPIHSLDEAELCRLVAFACDPGMRVNTAVYRANRLAPIHSALARTCCELGSALAGVLHRFWSSSELEDREFPNAVARFVAFLRRRERGLFAQRRGLEALLGIEQAQFELLLLPRRTIRYTMPPDADREGLHPLVRIVPVDIDPEAMLAVAAGSLTLAEASPGSGAILVDHRTDPGTLRALSSEQLALAG